MRNDDIARSVADEHTNPMRPVSIYNESKKHTSTAQDPMTSLENAETAYIDMQMSRLADVTERIDKGEKYLTALEQRINSTQKMLESGLLVQISM